MLCESHCATDNVTLRGGLLGVLVDAGGAEEDTALGGVGGAGTADGGGGAGDDAGEALPGFFEGEGNRAGTDVADVLRQAVDQLATDAEAFELHAGEADDAAAGLVRDDEADVIA